MTFLNSNTPEDPTPRGESAGAADFYTFTSQFAGTAMRQVDAALDSHDKSKFEIIGRLVRAAGGKNSIDLERTLSPHPDEIDKARQLIGQSVKDTLSTAMRRGLVGSTLSMLGGIAREMNLDDDGQRLLREVEADNRYSRAADLSLHIGDKVVELYCVSLHRDNRMWRFDDLPFDREVVLRGVRLLEDTSSVAVTLEGTHAEVLFEARAAAITVLPHRPPIRTGLPSNDISPEQHAQIKELVTKKLREAAALGALETTLRRAAPGVISRFLSAEELEQLRRG